MCSHPRADGSLLTPPVLKPLPVFIGVGQQSLSAGLFYFLSITKDWNSLK